MVVLVLPTTTLRLPSFSRSAEMWAAVSIEFESRLRFMFLRFDTDRFSETLVWLV